MFTKDTIAKISAMAVKAAIEPAAVLAVAEVESAGVTAWPVGGKDLPPIRFEGHYFHRLLKGKELAQAVAEGLASPKVGGVKNPNSYSARYALLERAKKINETAALESTSWGLGQVMGANYSKLGYSTVQDMVAEAMARVDGQIDVMMKYIEAFHLVDELQSHGWRKFADQYNGPASAKNNYASKIAAAYKTYSASVYADPTKPLPHTANAIVKGYQASLKTLGYYKGTVDGFSGPMTEAAVTAFQKDHGLVADGIYGKMTDEAVTEALANKGHKGGDTAVKTGTGVTGVGAAVDVIQTQAQQLDSVAQYSHVIGYVVAALVITGVAITLAGLYKKYKANGLGV